MEDVVMDVLVALALVLGGHSGSPVDRVLPEVVSTRIRLLTVREGMSQEETIRRLGLKGRSPTVAAATMTNSRFIYPIGRAHELTIWYSLRDGPGISHGLTQATLSAKDRP